MVSTTFENFVKVLCACDHAESQIIKERESFSYCEVALHVRQELVFEYELEFIDCFLDLFCLRRLFGLLLPIVSCFRIIFMRLGSRTVSITDGLGLKSQKVNEPCVVKAQFFRYLMDHCGLLWAIKVNFSGKP